MMFVTISNLAIFSLGKECLIPCPVGVAVVPINQDFAGKE
jgi:hypothetical protein